MMTGRGLRWSADGGGLAISGFVKNQYVLAATENQAKTRAIDRVRARLQGQGDAVGLAIGSVSIKVDAVARSLKYWKLVQQEGFVFFTEEGDE
jgi:hypothetical protein